MIKLATEFKRKLCFLGAAWLISAGALGCLFGPAPVEAQAGDPPRCDWSDQDYDDFYTTPDLGQFAQDRLGELLRVEHIVSISSALVAEFASLPSSPYGASVYRVLFLSQEPPGTPQAVSGLVVIPTGVVPEEGFPVAVDGHATLGLADSCAPSRSFLRFRLYMAWTAAGYVISAPDFVGLGLAGDYPHAVGRSEAYGMLDGARAALRFCDDARGIGLNATNRIILQGHAQGGHAALFAQQYARTYAPKLDIVTTVAFAPDSELRYSANLMASSFLVSPMVQRFALAMYAYSRVYGEPDTLGAWLREPYASELPAQAEALCIWDLSLWLGPQPYNVFRNDLLTAMAEDRWDQVEPWTSYFETNTPGKFTGQAPVLILHGDADELLPIEASELLTQRLCTNRTPTALAVYPGVGHDINLNAGAREDALQWIADRLAGLPATSACQVPDTVFLPMILQ